MTTGVDLVNENLIPLREVETRVQWVPKVPQANSMGPQTKGVPAVAGSS